MAAGECFGATQVDYYCIGVYQFDGVLWLDIDQASCFALQFREDEHEEADGADDVARVRTFGMYEMTTPQIEKEVELRMLYEDKIKNSRSDEDREDYLKVIDNYQRPDYTSQKLIGWFVESF